ncbi:MAG: gspD, partial [Verrucomicrobia bacterium]|nr:gspD [Verrucomicrobiota bacterium]
MKKITVLSVACLGAAALNLVAQTPPAPGSPPPVATTNTVPTLPGRVVPSRTPTTPAAQVPALPSAQTPAVTPANQAVQQVPTPAPPGSGVPTGQMAPGAAGATTRAAEAVIPIEDLRFPNMEMMQFLDVYAEQVGKTLIYGQQLTGLLKNQVTLKIQTPLTKAELIQAMESVLAQNGVAIVPMGDKFATVVPEALAFQQGARFKTTGADQIVEAQSFETRIVSLTNALPSEVQAVLTPFSKVPNGIIAIDGTRKLILRDYAVNLKRMVELIEQLDVNIPMEVELELIPIKYALSADMASVLGSLTSGGAVTGGTTSSRNRTGGLGSTSRTGSTGGSLGVGGNTSAGGIQSLQNQARPGQPNVPGQQSAFQNQLASIVNRAAQGGNNPILGDAKIIPDERTNALLVFGTKEERKMIKDIIE